MFKNIFPDKLNRLVYADKVDRPSVAPAAAKAEGGAAKDTVSQGLKVLKQAEIAERQRQAKIMAENIRVAVGTKPATAQQKVNAMASVLKMAQREVNKDGSLTPLETGGVDTVLIQRTEGKVVAVLANDRGNVVAVESVVSAAGMSAKDKNNVSLDMLAAYRAGKKKTKKTA